MELGIGAPGGLLPIFLSACRDFDRIRPRAHSWLGFPATRRFLGASTCAGGRNPDIFSIIGFVKARLK